MIKTNNKIKQLQGEIESISRRLKELEETNKRVYVPKSIQLEEVNDQDGSLSIINPINQKLFKCVCNGSESFDVIQCVGDDNENTGDNYYLKEVEKPEAGKAYYVTDSNDLYSIDSLFQYRIFLNEETQCCWNKFNEYYSVGITNGTWNHYYEIVKEER